RRHKVERNSRRWRRCKLSGRKRQRHRRNPLGGSRWQGRRGIARRNADNQAKSAAAREKQTHMRKRQPRLQWRRGFLHPASAAAVREGKVAKGSK
ncbi:unnamed protein product, partial [Ectocarpus sp. 4 AP-2014]